MGANLLAASYSRERPRGAANQSVNSVHGGSLQRYSDKTVPEESQWPMTFNPIPA
jgi:hypothetical protein